MNLDSNTNQSIVMQSTGVRQLTPYYIIYTFHKPTLAIFFLAQAHARFNALGES